MGLKGLGLILPCKDPFTIHASDCVTARPEQLDNWHPPSEHKAEPRSKVSRVFNTWLRYAEEFLVPYMGWSIPKRE